MHSKVITNMSCLAPSDPLLVFSNQSQRASVCCHVILWIASTNHLILSFFGLGKDSLHDILIDLRNIVGCEATIQSSPIIKSNFNDCAEMKLTSVSLRLRDEVWNCAEWRYKPDDEWQSMCIPLDLLSASILWWYFFHPISSKFL